LPLPCHDHSESILPSTPRLHTFGIPALRAWVREAAALACPDRIVWCDGSEAEYDRLCDEMVAGGTLRRLNPTLRPNSYLALSDPTDVARVERSHVHSAASEKMMRARPTTGSRPTRLRATMRRLFAGCMRGTHDVRRPVSMGPLGSHISHIGIELTTALTSSSA
jgi:phosphoenolpyruvate carboxykinase (GTP)